jgi:hypothetical protein
MTVQSRMISHQHDFRKNTLTSFSLPLLAAVLSWHEKGLNSVALIVESTHIRNEYPAETGTSGDEFDSTKTRLPSTPQ